MLTRFTAPRAQFDVRDEGTLVIITPRDAATDAALRRITPSDAQWFGGLVVEPRYAGDIIAALQRGEGF